MINPPTFLTLVPTKSVTKFASTFGLEVTPNPIKEFDPKIKSTSVVYGDGLSSELATSILFLIIVSFFCAEVVEKSSTKNPDLNLFNPFTSLIKRFEVSVSNKEREV